MVETILASTAHLPVGSFDFTPEGYARASYWLPEDAFTWADFPTQSFSSVEELEATRTEFKAKSAGKLQVENDIYWERSLRTLFPDRWTLAYTRDKAWMIVNDKKEPLYSRMKRTLYFKSIILGYGDGPIHRALPSREIAKYIKEHCASSARLKAIALRAYESVANMGGYHTWNSVSPPIFLCLAAAKSSLDAMSAVLWALLFHDTPSGKKIPSMRSLYEKLEAKQLPFRNEFAKLHQSSWFTKLQLARDRVVHRSASPVVHDKFGVAFDFDLGLFRDIRPGILHLGKPRVGLEKNMKLVHLDEIMKGFIVGLEKWEKAIARKLARLAWFPSFNTDGVLLGIEFADQNLLRDGSGPSHMVTSHPQGESFKYMFFGLHPFNKGSKPAPSSPPKAGNPQ